MTDTLGPRRQPSFPPTTDAMKHDDEQFDFLYDDCEGDDFAAAAHWLHRTLTLRDDVVLAAFPAGNSEAGRAVEFLRFYAQNPTLRGWRKYVAAELVAESLKELVQCEPEKGSERDLAEVRSLLQSLREDRRLYHFLSSTSHPSVAAEYSKWNTFLRETYPAS